MLAQRLSPPNLVFPLLNEPQQAPAGPAIGFVRFRREDTVASMCFLVQNRKNGPGQRMGEIANCLAHLADWIKPTAKFHSWFSDIGRPRLKA
jgi:hypothetical protein